jgi:hypothetical protein
VQNVGPTAERKPGPISCAYKMAVQFTDGQSRADGSLFTGLDVRALHRKRLLNTAIILE